MNKVDVSISIPPTAVALPLSLPPGSSAVDTLPGIPPDGIQLPSAVPSEPPVGVHLSLPPSSNGQVLPDNLPLGISLNFAPIPVDSLVDELPVGLPPGDLALVLPPSSELIVGSDLTPPALGASSSPNLPGAVPPTALGNSDVDLAPSLPSHSEVALPGLSHQAIIDLTSPTATSLDILLPPSGVAAVIIGLPPSEGRPFAGASIRLVH